MNESLGPVAHEVARDLSARDGRTWQVDQLYETWALLSCGDDVGIAVIWDRHDTRLNVRTEYKRRLSDHQWRGNPHDEPPRISVSRTRTPSAIAADIARRLLPGARAIGDTLRARADRAEASAGRIDAVLSDLEQAIGADPADRPQPFRPTQREYTRLSIVDDGVPLVAAHVSDYNGRQSVGLWIEGITPDQAREIVARFKQ